MTKMTSASSSESCSSHGKGISSRRRRTCFRIALFLSLINVLLTCTVAGPVFAKNFQASHQIQAGRNIRHLPCKIKRSGDEGICMFAIDCLKSNGTHLGTCIDRFYFGSCCQLKDERDTILDHEIDDNRIDGLLSNLLPTKTSLSKLPNSNNYSNSSHRVTTSRTPVRANVTVVYLTDEVTRKTTTKRPVSTISTSSSSITTSSSSSQKPTSSASQKKTTATTPATSSSTNFEMISVSSGVLLNKNKPTTSGSATTTTSQGTTVFATLSTRLPAQNDKTATGSTPSTATTATSSSKRPSSNKPTTIRVPLPAATTTQSPPLQKNDETTSSVDMLEFTTFQSVNSVRTTTPAAPVTTSKSSSRRPPSTTTSTRKPVPVITKKPAKTPNVNSTSPKPSPPRRTPATKLPVQGPIIPQREPPALSHLKGNNTTTKRPRPPAISTRRPATTLADDKLIQISISPPRSTTKKPLPNQSPVITKKPQVQAAQDQKKKPIVVLNVPTTTPLPPTTTTTTTTERPTMSPSTTQSPAEEPFTTISYVSVQSTRAPRPKPTPTGIIEQVSNTGWEDLITVEEGDEELQGTTKSPLMTEDGTQTTMMTTKPNNAAADSDPEEGDGGGEQRTTTQKPVKITTSVKVETTTSSTTVTTTTADPTAAPTKASSSSASPPVTTESSTTTTTTTTPKATTTTTTELPTTISSSSSSTVPNESSSASTAAAGTTVSVTEGPKRPVFETSEGDEEEMTTLAEGIVTWTSDLSQEEDDKDEEKKTTTEASTGEWVPLLTISSDDFKNASTPITSGTTTPMTPTLSDNDDGVETSEGNSTVFSEVPTTATAHETETATAGGEDGDDSGATTTARSPVAGNETTTLLPADGLLANVTERPSFPSLEGVDYRMICGKRMFPEPRIVGGAMASFGRWPWQISLRQWRTSTYLHKCGAALLNENWAVTAAHCVDNVPPSDLLLRLGEFDLAEEDEPYGYLERRVQIVASHPQFDPRTFEYDLALLRFYEPVVFQPNIIPICVPESDEDFIGRTAFVTGWGRLYEDGPLPSKLQEVSVPVIENKICETMYRSAGYIEHIPNIFICAGWKKGGYDSCEGDSGGPMVIQRDDKRFQLAGVISWGIGCAEPDQPGVYTRISEFRVWINQILQF